MTGEGGVTWNLLRGFTYLGVLREVLGSYASTAQSSISDREALQILNFNWALTEVVSSRVLVETFWEVASALFLSYLLRS